MTALKLPLTEMRTPAQEVVLANGGGPFVEYYPLEPTLQTSINIDHHASDNVEVAVTNAVPSDGEAETILAKSWRVVYDDTTPTEYFAGDDRILTCARVTTTPTNDDVIVNITQAAAK